MRNKKTTHFAYFFITIAILSLSTIGCKGKNSQKIDSDYVTGVPLNIVHPPSLKTYLEGAKKRFEEKNFRLSGNKRIIIEMTEMPNEEAYDKIASGKIKPDAWFASPVYIELSNANIRNLGARQTDCREILASPIVLVGNKKDLLEEQRSLFQSLTALTDRDLKIGKKKVRLATLNPFSFDSGLAALFQLDNLFSNNYSNISWYGNNTEHLRKKITANKDFVTTIGLVSEQQAIKFNSKTKGSLKMIYPEEGSAWQVSKLCRSDAAWATKDKLAAFSFFAEFLRSSSEIQEVQRQGFRAFTEFESLSELDSEEKLKSTEASKSYKNFGLNSEMPKSIIQSPDLVNTRKLLDGWNDARTPRLVTILMDLSGTMSGEPLAFTIAAVSKFIETLDKNDFVEIVTFGTETEIFFKQSDDLKKAANSIRKLEARGGSSLYDAIRISLERVTQRANTTNFNQSMIILTDGRDTSSKATHPVIRGMLTNVISNRSTDLFIFGIQTEDTLNVADLRDLARSCYGEYIETNHRDLSSKLVEVRKSI